MSSYLDIDETRAMQVLPTFEMVGNKIGRPQELSHVRAMHDINGVNILTRLHGCRVALHCLQIASDAPDLYVPPVEVTIAAAGHDNGKHKGMTADIMDPGILAADRYEFVQTHALHGMRTVLDNRFHNNDDQTYISAAVAGLHHYADGYIPREQAAREMRALGFSEALTGELTNKEGDIARMIALTSFTDIFDAVWMGRPCTDARRDSEGMGGDLTLGMVLAIIKKEFRGLVESSQSIRALYETASAHVLDNRKLHIRNRETYVGWCAIGAAMERVALETATAAV